MSDDGRADRDERNDDRVTALEERVAWDSKRVADLDDVVLAFTRRVEDLERTVAELKRQLSETREGLREPMEPHDTRPPHY